ncbi:MAG: hypothetical protein P857_377 [Candidatus Xenolissoclinum pacificiensis L6]|uniref:Insertion element IS402-like domain-containing protein n=1 Tax=Candidatus Xenolissoclinum pacificiensis L6 TaxID=1401685 RepID=W2V1C0_9RICK|nr:MAG: hypothetical protein P857_377 [Candidatus Xenolissoclinum pacificiensis L6]
MLPVGRKGNNFFLEGTCWSLRTGATWRDLPKKYGSWKMVYNRGIAEQL